MQLLYIANRYERKADLQRWLDGGLILVCDRYVASSIAYGEAQGLSGAWLATIQTFLPPPSLTIVLDIAPETAVARKAVDRDRYERDLSLQTRVRAKLSRAGRRRGLGRARRRARQGCDRRRRVQRGGVTTRAAVSARTSRTPASLSTRAHASSVAPVVLTSSIRTTTDPSSLPPPPPFRPSCQREGAADVTVTTRGRKPGLRPGGTVTAKGPADRHAQMAREVGGLIEPALAPPRRVERHRNRPVGARQHVGAADAHQFGQRPRQRSPSFVFQRVHDRAQRAVVPADGARAIHLAGAAPAAGTSRQRNADRPPGRQRIAAAVADGGVSGRIDRQQDSQTGPDVGCSRSCPQAAQDGARRTERTESAELKGRAAWRADEQTGKGNRTTPGGISIRSAFPHRRSRP